MSTCLTFAEAIEAIQRGCTVMDDRGGTFWLIRDKKGRAVLMHEPVNYGRAVPHSVFSSEHFDRKSWKIVDDPTT